MKTVEFDILLKFVLFAILLNVTMDNFFALIHAGATGSIVEVILNAICIVVQGFWMFYLWKIRSFNVQ